MSTDDLIPPLRPGVRLTPTGPDGAATLEDPALGRRIRLDPRGHAVARALDAPQALAALATRLTGDVEAIARAVQSFGRLHLLDTPEARALADDALQLDAIADADRATVPLLVRDDARFSCTMCGSCCGGHNIGPVFADVLDGLAPFAADLEAATRTAKGLFFALDGDPDADPDDADARQILCHQTHGSCVFLMDDRRCHIHAALGGDMKPRACRIFPYEFVATPRGVVVTVQRECRGFPEARLGRRLADDLPTLRHLVALAPGLAKVRRIIHLTHGNSITWATYERLESALHKAADAHPADPLAALLACRAVLVTAAGDDPDAPVPRADAPTLRADLDALVASLSARVHEMRAAVPAPTEGLLVRADALDHLALALGGLREELPRAVAPLARPDQRELFAEHLHHALMGKALATAPTALAGFARLSFGWLLAMSFAIQRARQVKRRHLVAQDVMDALVITSFLMRHDDITTHLLAPHDDALVDLFLLRLPALVAAAPALPEIDRRLELVKF